MPSTPPASSNADNPTSTSALSAFPPVTTTSGNGHAAPTTTPVTAPTSQHGGDGPLYDVVVVGASFAGLSFASVAAARGLRVLVLERDPVVGGVVRTTGILFSDVFDFMEVPERYLLNAVRRMRIRPQGSDDVVTLESAAYRFYMGDVTGMLQWMAEHAEGHGAEIRCGAMFQDATREADGAMTVSYALVTPGADSAPTSMQAQHARGRFLIGADGARSRVAQRMGLDQNTRILAGAEWLVEGVALDCETFHLVMDATLAPGYCVWLAPHGKQLVALGVAGRMREFKPNESLRIAQSLFGDVADLSRMRIVERKGGNIPVGGRLKRTHCDDRRGRALLLGDAAGLCGAATGGGIYPALISGRLAAHAVANELLNGVPDAIAQYERQLLKAGNLGPYLRIEDWLRFLLDHMATNDDLRALLRILGSPEGNRLATNVLFETPIMGMDGSLFNSVRSLLGQHPSVYRSAAQMVWRRLTAGSRA